LKLQEVSNEELGIFYSFKFWHNLFTYENAYGNIQTNIGPNIGEIFELTTISDPNYVTLKMPMPYAPQNTIAYLDIGTGACVYFHEDGKLWSANHYRDVSKLLNDPATQKNPNP